MKAPDKIYVAKTTFPEYVDWEGSPINTKEVSDNDICYIRKDALMEWANKQKDRNNHVLKEIPGCRCATNSCNGNGNAVM